MDRVPSELLCKLKDCVDNFNNGDEEIYPQLIPNACAEDFLAGQIPLVECPDSLIEKTYYFRWWTYRKHIKETEKGHIITEFLPPVSWAGPYNSIVCPACLHIREGRWLSDPDGWLKEYIDFWLDQSGKTLAYSSWLAHAVWEYCSLRDELDYAVEKLPQLIGLFEEREAAHKKSCGLYWSQDGRDGMEYSISGSGLRPTLNSYACADALAIAKIAKAAGLEDIQKRFSNKAIELKSLMDRLLWDRDFYRTLPMDKDDDFELERRPEVAAERDAKELLGLIPWCFDLPDEDKARAFGELLSDEGFLAPFGLTTAERRHPRFMEEHAHECLWNGPVWPFSTSQTLVAAANLLRDYKQDILTRDDYFRMLSQYAASHLLKKENGSTAPWIDECIHPFTGRWMTRDILQKDGWNPKKGGYERGKDYNHSLFCDLVLSGLFGIHVKNGTLAADPLIPDSWEWFRVENLCLHGKRFSIIYDKYGTRYGLGSGVTIRRAE